MFKKNFRDVYLIGISFIAGVLFVVQCGGQVEGVAESIAEALGISYDNASSNLSSSTVQDAIGELDNRFPLVFDSNENVIGIFLDKQADGWSVWNFEYQAVIPLDPLTGEVIQDDPKVHFTGEDCTGTAYLLFQEDGGVSETGVVEVGNIFYYPNFRGDVIRARNSEITQLNSTLTIDEQTTITTCSPFTGENWYSSSSGDVSDSGDSGDSGESTTAEAVTKAIYDNEIDSTYVETRVVELPSFSAPLYLGKSIE